MKILHFYPLWGGYLVPGRDAPGVLPDVESSWDAVAVVAAAAVAAAAVPPPAPRGRPPRATAPRPPRPPATPAASPAPRRRPAGAPYAAHTGQVRLDESYMSSEGQTMT